MSEDSLDVIHVPFMDGEIMAMRTSNGIYVAIKPICEHLGLDPVAQSRRIRRNFVMSKGAVMMATPSEGGV